MKSEINRIKVTYRDWMKLTVNEGHPELTISMLLFSPMPGDRRDFTRSFLSVFHPQFPAYFRSGYLPCHCFIFQFTCHSVLDVALTFVSSLFRLEGLQDSKKVGITFNLICDWEKLFLNRTFFFPSNVNTNITKEANYKTFAWHNIEMKEHNYI